MLPKSFLAPLAVLLVPVVPVAPVNQDQQSPTVIAVDAVHPGAAISPTMFGIFFEDINFAADGGLYPELLKNRSFEFDQPLTGWHANLNITPKCELGTTQGELNVLTEAPLNKTNTHYLRV